MLICPVCAAPLTREERAFRCANGHSFDLARQGYVHLIGSRHPGDTKPMLQARRAFLAAGHYRPLADALADLALAHLASQRAARPAGAAPPAILDAGCGEGYYIGRLCRTLADAGIAARCFGLDVAKEAVRMAAAHAPEVQFLVADIKGRLPFADASLDVLLNVFAPRNPAEFARVLAPGGLLLVAIPTPAHLAELRAILPLLAIEDQKREHVLAQLAGAFALAASRELAYELALDPAEARLLITMTPSHHHLDMDDLDRALAAAPVRVTAAFSILALVRDVAATATNR
jgi:23S rRNA (guanine745-N1)-methyltransferase